MKKYPYLLLPLATLILKAEKIYATVPCPQIPCKPFLFSIRFHAPFWLEPVSNFLYYGKNYIFILIVITVSVLLSIIRRFRLKKTVSVKKYILLFIRDLVTTIILTLIVYYLLNRLVEPYLYFGP